MTIKEILNNLEDKDRRLLMYAFENSIAQFVALPDGKYVGVNTSNIKHLAPEQVAGVWSYGKDNNVHD